jgi:hypothetical protein
MFNPSKYYNKIMGIEEIKFNIFNLVAITAGMFLTNIESVLSILVLGTALIYNIIKIFRQNKP